MLKQAIHVVNIWFFSFHSQISKRLFLKWECSKFPRNHIDQGSACRRGWGFENRILFPDLRPYLHNVKWALYLFLAWLLATEVKDINTSLLCLDESFSRNKGNVTITLPNNIGAVPTTKGLGTTGIMIPLEEVFCGQLNIKMYLFLRSELCDPMSPSLFCVLCNINTS